MIIVRPGCGSDGLAEHVAAQSEGVLVHISRQMIEFSALDIEHPHPALLEAFQMYGPQDEESAADERVFGSGALQALVEQDNGRGPMLPYRPSAFDEYEVVGLMKWVVDDVRIGPSGKRMRSDTGYQALTLGELLATYGLFTKSATIKQV